MRSTVTAAAAARLAALVVAALLAAQRAAAFGPRVYAFNETIPVYFNKAVSDRTHLGQVLRGDRIIASDLAVRALVESTCELLCSKPVHHVDVALARAMIAGEYRVEWILDDLPGATAKASVAARSDLAAGVKRYDVGFPLGFHDQKSNKFHIFNHVLLNIVYQIYSGSRIVIVGFEVYPKSVRTVDGMCPPAFDLDTTEPMVLPERGHTTIDWTYSVQWQLDTGVAWAHRWDMYIVTTGTRVHWFSVANSVAVVALLSALVAAVVVRTLRRDIAAYNRAVAQEDGGGGGGGRGGDVGDDGVVQSVAQIDFGELDEAGWKALHGDVFRAADMHGMLCVLVGSGVQFISAGALTLLLSLLGFTGHPYSGGLLTVSIFAYVLSGYFGGFATARLHKMFRGIGWRRYALLTALLAPCTILLVFFALNLVVWSNGSSFAIPAGTFFALLLLIFGLSLPLVYAGAYAGQRTKPHALNTRATHIPRPVPPQPWYLDPFWQLLLAGACPFSVVYMELYFILDAVWQAHHVHHLAGFVALVAVLLVATCAEVAVVVVYVALAREDHRWQWRAFSAGGAAAAYVFAYAVVFYAHSFDVGLSVAGVLFFAYCILGSLIFWLCTGTIGYLSSLVFVAQIYSSVKID
ncbi:hypothetical protein HK105_209041 [Polyrhizophydium stewartii]|uniref:Transmembrane 9 superfamily member n=1 Tax=Polyrhizophydium stewartii TaxID=2732419 RepID=A0ABR4MW66_9FUNG